MKRNFAPLFLLGFSVLISGTPALAARQATVDTDNVELREGPGPKYKVIEKLSLGTPVAASNQTIEGYYKIRTSNGTIGFVLADALVLQPTPTEEAQPAPFPV